MYVYVNKELELELELEILAQKSFSTPNQLVCYF